MAEVKTNRSKSEAQPTRHERSELRNMIGVDAYLCDLKITRGLLAMSRTSFRCWLVLLAATVTLHASQAAASSVTAVIDGDRISLSNESLSATWSVRGGALRWASLTNHFSNSTLPITDDAFELVPREGSVLRSSDLKIVDGPLVEDALTSTNSSRAADHIPGRQARIELEDPSTKMRITWTAILREDSNYIRQEISIHAAALLPLSQAHLVTASVPGATVVGHVKGSPVAGSNFFFGFEHPISECRVRGERTECWLARELPMQPGQSVMYSSVFGVIHPGQLRRDFLKYLELERAHPYRPFLHYNTWYDLGYFDRYSEQDVINSLQVFGEQLNKQRGVKLDGLLLDDGWDDPATLWKFNPGFPDGLTKITETATKYGAAPGIWLSPWGGYDGPKKQRLSSARAQGFETNEGGFALSGPKYYRYFRDTCLDLIEKYSVNQFKFDGTGNANEVIAGSEFDSDFDAAIHLIGELRAKKHDLYVNLTTGTYPSPFWLFYADSIWRGGEDHSFAGIGTNRQRWITYRDSQLYRWVVEEGPLFPLNSLMLHGLIYARHAQRLGNDPGHDFADEVHSYLGTGTQLQEMYITPSLLSAQDWDVLAEAAKWSRENAATLKDSHWIGGDPALLEVYGWAAWSPQKGIVTLRNPSDHAQDFSATLTSLLELPQSSARRFEAHSPWKQEGQSSSTISADDPHKFHLLPFQVLTLELTPSAE
jgi:hypothetical protein